MKVRFYIDEPDQPRPLWLDTDLEAVPRAGDKVSYSPDLQYTVVNFVAWDITGGVAVWLKPAEARIKDDGTAVVDDEANGRALRDFGWQRGPAGSGL